MRTALTRAEDQAGWREDSLRQEIQGLQARLQTQEARAEELIKTNTMSIRADIMAIISEYNFAAASKGTFKDELSLRIKAHLNEKFRAKIPVNIIVDEVLLTRYIAN